MDPEVCDDDFCTTRDNSSVPFLDTLPLEVISHILRFCSFQDKLTLAALQNDTLNEALGSEVVTFYTRVARFLPCGRWLEPNEKKCYDIRLVPELGGLHIDFYTNSTRKRMCFNQRTGMRLVRKCRPLLDGRHELYFNKHAYYLDDERRVVKETHLIDDTYTHEWNNERYWKVGGGGGDDAASDRHGLIASACILIQFDNICVYRYNRVSRSMDTLKFKNNKLVSKIKTHRGHVSKAWLYYFCFDNSYRLEKMQRLHFELMYDRIAWIF